MVKQSENIGHPQLYSVEAHRLCVPESQNSVFQSGFRPPSAWTGGELIEINGQYAYLKNSDVKTKNGKNSHILRSRAKLEYNIKNCPFNPYLSYEFNNDLEESLHLDKTRMIVGTELKLTKQHRLDIAYIFQDYHGEDNLHAVSIGYKFKF